MISVVLYGRNDSYGYNLQKRAALSLNTLAFLLNYREDEILFVDYNTPDDLPTFIEAIADMLVPRAREIIRVIRVRQAFHEQHFAKRTHLRAIEPISRNIAARRINPKNRWILSTNTDMIFLPRGAYHGKTLSDIASDLGEGFYHAPRLELPEALWETLDRMNPRQVIDRTRDWGVNLQINEVVYGNVGTYYDGPGDFQLMLASDLAKIGGFHEEMLIGWHVDSNLSKRMMFIRESISPLQDRVFGYHCDHTREATLMHKHDAVANDLLKYFVNVDTPYVPEQMETWGFPDISFEEVRIAPDLSSHFVKAMQGIIPPFKDREYTIAAVSDDSGNDFRHATYHVVPYLANYIDTMPRDSAIAYVGTRRQSYEAFRKMWSALGCTGTIYIVDLFAERLGLTGGTDPQVEILSDEAFVSKADLFVFDYAPPSLTDELGPPTDHYVNTWVSTEDDNLALYEIGRIFARVTAREPWTRSKGSPRKFLVVHVQNTYYEAFVGGRVMAMYTPFSSRVRHGYVYTNKGKVLALQTARKDLSLERFGDIMPLQVCHEKDFKPRESLSRIAGVEDFLEPEWFRWADGLLSRIIGEPNKLSFMHWEIVHACFVLAQRGIFNDKTSVAIVCRELPKTFIQILTLWVADITVLKTEGNTLNLSDPVDVVIVFDNVACEFGLKALGGIFAYIDRLMKPGGLSIIFSELGLCGPRGNTILPIELVQTEFFTETLEQETGWRLCGPIDTTLSHRSLERFAIDLHQPRFLFFDHEFRGRSRLALVYEKVAETDADSWLRIEQAWIDVVNRTPDQYDALALARALVPLEPVLQRMSNWVPGENVLGDHAVSEIRKALWAELGSVYGEGGAGVIVPFYHGTRLMAYMGSESALSTYVSSGFEPNIFFVLSNLLRLGMVVIELGANEGFFTCFIAARVGSRGHVLTYEPHAAELQRVQKNLAINGFESNVTIVESPVVDTLVKTHDLQHVHVIRINARNFSATVFEGLAQTLQRFRPILHIEVSLLDLSARSESANTLLESLSERDYELIPIDRRTGNVIDWTSFGEFVEHVFAVPREAL